MKQIEKMSDEEFCAFLENHDRPWCYGKTCADNLHCTDCRKKWAEATYKEPMPELKAGMFVEADNGFGAEVGIITVDDDDNMIVVYFTRGWDFVSNVTINKIYKAHCQDECNSNHIIWKKS